MLKRRSKIFIETDFHSHILPGMDDGAENVQVSLGQLSLLREQGIARVNATPHFYHHRESLDSFLERRESSHAQLLSSLPNDDMPKISLGAEVYLEQSLLETRGIEQLRIANSDYVLLEIPYTGANSSTAELIFNICRQSGVKPMLAHLDRYISGMPEGVLHDLLSLDDLIIQINNSAFQSRSEIKFVLDLIRDGFPVAFGSDTHNMTSRKPNFDVSNKLLSSKLKEDELAQLIRRQKLFLYSGTM